MSTIKIYYKDIKTKYIKLKLMNDHFYNYYKNNSLNCDLLLGGNNNNKNKNKFKFKYDKYNDKNNKKVKVSHIARQMDDEVHFVKDYDITIKNFIMNMFPDTVGLDKQQLIINKVGFYSMTTAEQAESIMKIIETYVKRQTSTLLDVTTGIGGFIINM